MGNTWVVQAWTKRGEDDYHDVEVFRGESLWRAILAMIHAKRSGIGCISLEWRP